jgi:hypothetical protein
MLAKILVWVALALCLLLALRLDAHAGTLMSKRPLSAGNMVVWAAFAAFVAYSVYCSGRENLLASIRTIARLHWGRQIGIDLYLGLCISFVLIYLHEGSALSALLWFVPALLFVNQVTLFYFAVHYDSIISRFTQ